jgi:3-phenylpropionate/cinnamic acid dioxygenase small subunit
MTAEEGGRGMDEAALRLAVGDLNAAYADCIDDDRLEEWPDFFVENCRYLITDRTSHEAGLRHGIIYAASKGMLTDRVMAMRGANIFEPHRYRHLVGPARIDRVMDGVAEARTNFFAVRIMHNGDSQLFATGRYLDRIDVAQTPFRFIERLVILDSQKIDTLLVLPL